MTSLISGEKRLFLCSRYRRRSAARPPTPGLFTIVLLPCGQMTVYYRVANKVSPHFVFDVLYTIFAREKRSRILQIAADFNVPDCDRNEERCRQHPPMSSRPTRHTSPLARPF